MGIVAGLFLIRVCNVPVLLLSISYYLWTTGVQGGLYLLNLRLRPNLLKASLATKKLTFQRWVVLHNSKKIPKDFLDSAIAESVKGGR